jgi:hypothetical protein
MSYYSSTDGNVPLSVGAGITIIIFVLCIGSLGRITGKESPCDLVQKPAVVATNSATPAVKTQSVATNRGGRLPVPTNGAQVAVLEVSLNPVSE